MKPGGGAMTNGSDSDVIELRLNDAAQLFNNLDPYPFRERDLAADAEEFIVSWAQDLPKHNPLAIRVHLPSADAGVNQDADLQQAIQSWFHARAEGEARAMTSLFRDGRIAFLIGFAALGLCMTLSWAATKNYDHPFSRLVSESLVIVGWVVLWRPAEIFLYDWTPIWRRKRLFRRLADARVTVQRG